MPQEVDDTKELPLDIAGSSIYGRSPKVQSSRTFNMIVADEWLQDYSGYKNRLTVSSGSKGRGIFGSVFDNIIIEVYNNIAYKTEVFNDNFNPSNKTYISSIIGELETFSGDVFIDENVTNQIGICDKKNIYIYNTITHTFIKVFFTSDFIPGYIVYQNGSFASPNLVGPDWALSDPTDALNWYWGNSGQMVSGGFQTKPDKAVAVIKAPGQGGIFYVMGSTVTEIWSHQPTPNKFPYIKSTTTNIDYGCVNAATVATLDKVIVWLGQNEKSGPVILYTTGGSSETKKISTDGLDYALSKLHNPQKSSGFLMRLSGHLFYQLTFYDPLDNFSIVYDFDTNMFFDVTDEKMDHHVARRVDFFNGSYYFVSFHDGNLYELSADFFTFDYGIGIDASKIYEIPRIRICSNTRTPDQDIFIIQNLTFTLEQGEDSHNVMVSDSYKPSIGLRMSKNGGYSYGGESLKEVYTYGKRINKLNWWKLGRANDFVAQIRFYGKGPFRATNGALMVYI